MAYRVMMKIMLSNAWEIIYENYNGSKWSDNPDYHAHRNYIPPKPEDPALWERIHQRFKTSQEMLLDELTGRYPELEDLTQEEEKKILLNEYYEYMSNAKIVAP
jgi:hypothetical protein